MNYITVTQLSERWQVTPRYIQILCRDGRLHGAVRMGKQWMLPVDTERPSDHRYKNAAKNEKSLIPTDEICWSVMGAAYHIPGTEAELIKSLADKPEAQELTTAQFAYLHGDIELCAELSGKLFSGSDIFEIKIGAAFLLGICAMYNGYVEGWLNARKLMEKLPCPNEGYIPRKELWLAIFSASIFDLSGFPEWFSRGCFAALPVGYYPTAFVHYIKYIYIRADAILKNQPLDGKWLDGQIYLLPAICEPLICQTSLDKAIICEIYLRLFCASSYHHDGNDELAIEHIDRALALALPDRILAPFAEQRSILDSLIDTRMKALDTDAYNEMRALHTRMLSGWTAIHNTVLNRSHTTELTAKELEAARLAVFGLTNDEIAVRMGISINSVKAYLQTAKEKTGVKKRTELAKFI